MENNIEVETVQRIKKIRKEHGLNQSDFSSSIGLSQPHYCNVEKGIKPITERLLKNICFEFKINYEWLATGQGQPYQENNFTNSLKNIYKFNQDDLNFFKSFCKTKREERDTFLNSISTERKRERIKWILQYIYENHVMK